MEIDFIFKTSTLSSLKTITKYPSPFESISNLQYPINNGKIPSQDPLISPIVRSKGFTFRGTQEISRIDRIKIKKNLICLII
jgi:hypothetical protein